MKFQARQGDLLIEEYDGPIQGAPVKPERGRLVLAKGEATGHDHSLPAKAGTLTLDGDGVMYLTIDELTEVRHQEHDPVVLAPRNYRVTRQREWTDQDEPREVAD